MEKLKQIGIRLCQLVLYPVRDNPLFFLFTFLINEEILIFGNLYSDHTNAFLGTLLPLADGYLLCIIASLLKKIRLRGIVWLTYGIVVLGETFSILFYHSQYNIRVMQLVMQTTGQESGEFILNALHTTAPWIAIGILLACWMIAYGLHRLYELNMPPLGKRIWMAVVVVGILWSAIREVPQYIRVGRCFQEDNTTLLGDYRHLPSMSGCLVRFTYSIAFNYVSSKEILYLVQTAQNTQVEACSHDCPTIVLIIGESFSKYHTPLYDPSYLAVNPYLSRMQKQGNLYAQTNAVACSNLTSVVMRNMFSTWNEDCTDEAMYHSLFPVVFRQAGYQVYFISNQFCLVGQDTWGMVGGTIFNQPELSRLQFTYRNPHMSAYDGGLLRYLPTVDSLTAQPSLLIFHVMGQHVDYESRYPQSMTHFTSDSMNLAFGGKHAREIAAHYANATLYHDSVVGALWEQYKDEDVIGIYVSDHSEEVYDWRNFYERSDINQMSKEVAKYQLEIPMFYLVTDTFKAQHPDIIEAIESSLDKPFISNNLCQLLFHLAGIRYTDYQTQRDLLSPNYDTTLPRMVGDGVNYDELMKN